jgi:uncharacterized protein with LGFP repeats
VGLPTRVFEILAARAVHRDLAPAWEGKAGVIPANPLPETAMTVMKFNHFAGGSIYWSPATGAHVVYGAIRATTAQATKAT